MAVAALLTCTTSSCINGDDGLTNDDWKAPDNTVSPYGNNSLEEKNVITIKELKDRTVNASSYTNGTDTVRITEDWQIKGRVTGNDIEGNVYNEVALEDESGEAILVCIEKGGLFGFLPVGQEILIDLKGLYIGTYASMPQIGVPYTSSSGYTSPSRMNFALFNEHFKLIGQPDASKVTAEEFDVSKLKDEAYIKSHTGKLMTLKNVEIDVNNDSTKWAPEEDKASSSQTAVNRTVKVNGKANSSLIVRTSIYADFAAKAIPTGKVNITGIFTVYNSNPSRYSYTWQILLRSEADVEPASN